MNGSETLLDLIPPGILNDYLLWGIGALLILLGVVMLPELLFWSTQRRLHRQIAEMNQKLDVISRRLDDLTVAPRTKNSQKNQDGLPDLPKKENLFPISH